MWARSMARSMSIVHVAPPEMRWVSSHTSNPSVVKSF